MEVRMPTTLAPTTADEVLFRDLYTRLGLGIATNRKVIGVTSAIDGEGKTTLATHLATALARDVTSSGMGPSADSVLLIDCNAGSASSSSQLQADSAQGLVAYLRRAVPLEEAISATSQPGLWIMPVGGSDRDRSVVIRNADLAARNSDLLRQFRAVIVDLPSILSSSDVRVIQPMIDELVLVIRAGITPAPLIREAIATVGEEHIGGIVLNDKRRNLPNWLEQRW
jgi:polysaccharide biosynthesis transport protein